MALLAGPDGSTLVCGQCGARHDFAPSFDRRSPLPIAFAAGWATARTRDHGLDFSCPACLEADRTPLAVPGEPSPKHAARPIAEASQLREPKPKEAWRAREGPLR